MPPRGWSRAGSIALRSIARDQLALEELERKLSLPDLGRAERSEEQPLAAQQAARSAVAAAQPPTPLPTIGKTKSQAQGKGKG